MERGYDKLMNPTGILIVTLSLFMVLVIVIGGGLIFRMLMERDKEVRRKLREASSRPDDNDHEFRK